MDRITRIVSVQGSITGAVYQTGPIGRARITALLEASGIDEQLPPRWVLYHARCQRCGADVPVARGSRAYPHSCSGAAR